MKRIKFLRGWSKYNRGDIAGFAPAKADELIRKGVAQLDGDGVPVKTPERAPASRAEVDAIAAQSQAGLDARDAALAAREAEIAERETALKAREAALAAGDDKPEPEKAGETAKGAPPKQGAAKK